MPSKRQGRSDILDATALADRDDDGHRSGSTYGGGAAMSASGPMRFDVFLSYNSQDREAVEEMARRLRAEGLTPYLEVDELAPGRVFQPGLAEALRDSKTCAMFLGP